MSSLLGRLSVTFGLVACPLFAASLTRQQGPSPRAIMPMAFDTVRQQSILFGGAGGTPLGDTWLFLQSGWQTVPLASGPLPRYGHVLVEDRIRGQVVLYGGTAAAPGDLGDTWTWNGNNWSMVVSPVSPPAREGAGCAYDTARQQIILFGGQSGSSAFGDTWAWSGTWTQLNPSVAPNARVNPRIVCHESRNELILYGGWSLGYLGDTWRWTGSNWVTTSPAPSPQPRAECSLAYDVLRDRVVLFGGHDHNRTPKEFDDTWEWDGVNWSQKSPIASPPGRTASAATYDAQRQTVVLFGGCTSSTTFGDTWLYDGNTWLPVMASSATFATFGSGCLGTQGMPQLAAAPNSLPRIGQTFTIRLTNLPSTAFFVPAFPFYGYDTTSTGGIPLPRDLGFLGMPGCTQYVDAIASAFIFTLGGTADWSVSIPGLASLAGLPVTFQAAVVDLPANTMGITVSNAGTAVLGF